MSSPIHLWILVRAPHSPVQSLPSSDWMSDGVKPLSGDNDSSVTQQDLANDPLTEDVGHQCFQGTEREQVSPSAEGETEYTQSRGLAGEGNVASTTEFSVTTLHTNKWVSSGENTNVLSMVTRGSEGNDMSYQLDEMSKIASGIGASASQHGYNLRTANETIDNDVASQSSRSNMSGDLSQQASSVTSSMVSQKKQEVVIPDQNEKASVDERLARDDGANLPDDGASLPDTGASLPDDGDSLPDDGASLPDDGASLPDEMLRQKYRTEEFTDDDTEYEEEEAISRTINEDLSSHDLCEQPFDTFHGM